MRVLALVLAFALFPAVAHAQSYPLPRLTSPGHATLASDGALWLANEYTGVTRVGAAGGTRSFLKGDDAMVSDLAAGAGGSVWVTTFKGAQLLDATGKVTRTIAGDEASVVATGGGAAWIGFAGGSQERPKLVHVSAEGTTRGFPLAAPRDALSFNGIAVAPDGSAWFTQSYDGTAWVGRMTTDGTPTSWALPAALGEPDRIAVGGDGALWFTAGHVLGRIDAAGTISSVPLADGLAAQDLATDPNGAVWFTSDICLGRVAAGAVTTWPVPGAVQLRGIAAAADGRLWLGDRAGNAVHAFTPGAPAPCGAPQLTRASGATSATVSFTRTDVFGRVDYFEDVRLRLSRQGQELRTEAIPGLHDNPAVFSDSTALTVRDFDGDGEPEVALRLNWGGAHCCSWSRVYRYDRAHNTYTVIQHWWGNGGAEPVLRDLDGDKRPEWLSLDDRFAEAFTSFAGSTRPPQIWSYRQGRLRDVTRRFPGRLRKDAAEQWRLYRKYRKTDATGILPAWMADQYLLGHRATADRVLARAVARGELEHAGFGPRAVKAYAKAVKALLRRTGYR